MFQGSKSSEHALYPVLKITCWSGPGWMFAGAKAREACVLSGAARGASEWFLLAYLGP